MRSWLLPSWDVRIAGSGSGAGVGEVRQGLVCYGLILQHPRELTFLAGLVQIPLSNDFKRLCTL